MTDHDDDQMTNDGIIARNKQTRTYTFCKPALNHSLLVRGERISAIACMSVNGLMDVKTVRGTCTGDTFYDFVHTHLMPHLMPFDGFNPHSVVVLDNCAMTFDLSL